MSRKRSVSSSSSSSSGSSSSNHSSKSSRSRSSSSGSSASNRSKKSNRSRNSTSRSGSSASSRSRSRSRSSTRSSRLSHRHSKSSSRERGGRRYRSRSRSHNSFKRVTRSISPRRRSKSPFNQKASKIYIGRLSRNVNKDHINEIFCNYGAIKSVELPADYLHPFLTRGFAYVEYEKQEEADKAIKYMDGGQIDGQVINVSIAVGPRTKLNLGRFNRRRQGWRPKHSPIRHLKRRRSPSPGYYRSRGPRRSISRSRSRDKDLKETPRRRRGSS